VSDRPVHHYTAYDARYQHTERYKLAHRARNKARYYEIKKLGKKALEGLDIDHKDPLSAGGSNEPSNWRVRSVASNRGDKSFRSRAGYHPLHLRD
jgi:hypothetical protein